MTNGTVNLYATGGSSVFAATDASGYNASASGAATSIVGPTTNEGYRGIAFLTQSIAFATGSTGAMPEPGALPLIAEAGALVAGFALVRRRRKA